MPSPGAPTGNQRYIVPTDGNQYSQTWSFTIQRAVTPSLMFEVAYVGTSGNRLLTASDINAALPGATNPTTRQPYGPALGEIRELSNSAHSIYHGLQSKIEKRFSGGLYFLGSYTWSKSIDNQSNGTDTAIASGQYPQDPLNASLDRGLSSFNRPQVLVGSVVWEIPFGRSPVEGSRARELVNGVLGGWQLSGILTAESGTPFSILMSCADINAEGDNCRPNRISSGVLPSDQQSINEWFNTAAFVIPSTPEYGSAGRNILAGPGLNDIDVAMSKSFPVGGLRNQAPSNSIGVLQRPESHQSRTPRGLHRFAGLRHASRRPCLGGRSSSARGSSFNSMRLQKAYTSFIENLWKQPDSPLLRYLLPFAGVGLALVIQASISWMLPKGTDFPYAFFYLIAIFG